MADKFWVGGGTNTNWNSSPTTNWANSSGGAGNQTAPGVGDKVFFDAASGSGTSVLNTAFTVQALNCTGYTGTLTHNSATTLTINTASVDSLILSSTMTYSPVAAATALITFTNTSGNADITTNGKRLSALTVNAVGGTVRLLDAIRVDTAGASALTLTAGTFNANGFAVTVSTFVGSNSNTRVLQMGGGDWTLGGVVPSGTTIWTLATTTNLTFTKGASNIVIPTNGLAGYRLFAGGGQTYNDLTVAQNSALGMIFISGANTFANWSIGAGNTFALPSGTTTVTNAPTLVGTKSLPIMFMGNTPGNVSTLSVTSGNLTLVNGGIRDVAATGGASFVATETFDYGNNAGWSITPPGDILTLPAIANAVWQQDVTSGFSVGTAGNFMAQVEDIADTVSDTNAIVDGTLDSDSYYDLPFKDVLKIILSAVAGKASGLDTATVIYRAPDDSQDVITATVDEFGNRTEVILTP